MRSPIVIAHRGVPALRLEHTRSSYELAIEMGADFIEPDVVASSDGVLVIRHENEISATTDVADRPEFASRRTTKTIDGVALDGWFTEDFTLDELKSLRTRERFADVRPQNVALNSREPILTLAEAIELAVGAGVGIYVETKHPAHFRSVGLDLDPLVLSALAGLEIPVAIESFETNLAALRQQTDAFLVQLIKPGRDRPSLGEIAAYADGIGPHKHLVIPVVEGRLAEPTSLVDEAHALGMVVHIWAMRDEQQFRPGTRSAAEEYRRYLDAGVDGFFADLTQTAVAARNDWLGRR
jgi:glycerophosphoryl diester phosphodiesterase